MNIAGEFHALFSIHGLAGLLVLSVLELVLGIDNIIFISLIIAKLPLPKRLPARVIGMSLALVMRIFMLFAIVWLSHFTTTLLSISGFKVTVKDDLFFAGGLYLAWNTFIELRIHLTGKKKKNMDTNGQLLFRKAVMQIVLADMLFSFDSIFTAIGLLQNVVIMALAVFIGMVFMVYLSGKIAEYINRYPSIKTFALSFIMGVALLLITSAFHIHIPKIYFYSAYGVAFVAVLLNLSLKKRSPSHS
ncbi:MAG: TerC family protein [Bacteroidia bacterium]